MVLGALLAGVRTAAARETIRLSQNLPNDAKPLIVDADEIMTWNEKGKLILLLKGKVQLQQNVVQASFQQGVLWIDLEQLQRTRVLNAAIYGEGSVRLDNGHKSQKGEKALLEITTRGEMKLNARKQKVIEKAGPDDPLYQRGLKERGQNQGTDATRSSAEAATGIQQVAASVPAQPGQTPPPPPSWTNPAMPPADGSAGTPVPRAQPPGAATPPSPAAPPRTRGSTQPLAPILGSGQQQFSIAPRTAAPFQTEIVTLPSGEQALVVTGGVILNVHDPQRNTIIDVEADKLVLWRRGESPLFINNLQSPDSQGNQQIEFYLAGNVELRQQQQVPNRPPVNRVLRADEIYYDVARSAAIAVNADIEYIRPRFSDPVHFKADEIVRVSESQWRATRGEAYSSKLASDPGFKVMFAEATLDENKVPKTRFLGLIARTRPDGEPELEPDNRFRAERVVFQIEDVPVFYLPWVSGDANDPFGPLRNISFGYNRIYGFMAGVSLDGYDLLGLDPIKGTRWHVDVNYLTDRGPVLGTDYNYAVKDMFGVPSSSVGLLKLFGMHDSGPDILGGGRGGDDHPAWRGRVLWRHMERDLPYGFSADAQVSLLSDMNYLEQFFPIEFHQGINQETFLFVKQQQDNWAWTLLTEGRVRDWVTETNWLPRADAFLIGQSLFDRLTYNAHANIAYAQLKPVSLGSPPVMATQQAVDAGRFDFMQELSWPFYLGPVKMAPYGLLDLTYYTQDLTGEDAGRIYYGLGARASMPLTRIYPDIESTLFNISGINHKILLTGNYLYARSNIPFTQLPQFDVLQDDASDQSLRQITPLQPIYSPGFATALAMNPALFNTQNYAIRRLVENRVDTLDSINVLQMGIFQRWQTHRGFPGNQHIVDWMTLDLSGSFFPQPDRDNFGSSFAFLQYDWVWNIGDRTALESTGWVDPIDDGPRVFTVGGYFNRPDRTSYYLGYRQIDPIGSKAVTAALSYVFSPKYAVTGSATYDFGTNQALSNALVLTRMGTDFQTSVGFTYNAMQNAFGFTFEVWPNLLPRSQRGIRTMAFGGPGRMIP